MKTPNRQLRSGFLLLEMVLALAIFAAATTGFVVALHRMAEAASLSQSETRVTRILESAMNEAMSLPMLEPGENRYEIEGEKIEIWTVIELMEDLETEEGSILKEMYRIEVTARWYENGVWEERKAETWRYGLMYQS